MAWVSGIVLLFLAIRLLVALHNLITRQWLSSGTVNGAPLVSVLIPARNEATNIGALLQSIQHQSYPHWEIIVYDDLSEDNTAQVVEGYTQKDSRIRLLNGQALPDGWLGKNHACHNLASVAKGNLLLFIDADVVAYPKLIEQAVAHLQRYQLDLLSIFPQQRMPTLGEKITVPLMNWILLSLLPLELTRTSPNPSFAAANGQFILFDAEVYRKYSFHQMVKNHRVEDIKIFQTLKTLKLKGYTVLSNGQVACRMYAGFSDAVQGFSKNIFFFFFNSPIVALLVALITTFGFVPLWFYPGGFWLAIWIAGELLLRVVVAVASRQNVVWQIVLWPLQQAAFLWMVLGAYRAKVFRTLQWKGRSIN
ncbi:MAG TPA: glycosyl transferase [Bacteroidales bacterium]|nr:glycosyl transferase [Bacteroidales bacterium]